MLIADACCNGRIISTLEGGYNLKALAASVAAHIGCLAGLNGGE
jgi:acetoin utilization deacetylase AcuC-like enzyme